VKNISRNIVLISVMALACVKHSRCGGRSCGGGTLTTMGNGARGSSHKQHRRPCNARKHPGAAQTSWRAFAWRRPAGHAGETGSLIGNDALYRSNTGSVNVKTPAACGAATSRGIALAKQLLVQRQHARWRRGWRRLGDRAITSYWRWRHACYVIPTRLDAGIIAHALARAMLLLHLDAAVRHCTRGTWRIAQARLRAHRLKRTPHARGGCCACTHLFAHTLCRARALARFFLFSVPCHAERRSIIAAS